jgi:RNA polymerase sigma factor (sigma-70 family)
MAVTRATAYADGVSPRAPAHDDAARLAAQHERFLAFLTRRLKDRAAAEDVLQSAYLKALASPAPPREKASVVAWFFRILRRSLVDRHRRERVRGAALETKREEARRAEQARDRALESAACACVQSLLDDLEPGQATILKRVDLGEETPAEAAAALGITPGNAAVRLHRARKALKARLQAVCGTCTEHHCLDCRCGPRTAGGSGARRGGV